MCFVVHAGSRISLRKMLSPVDAPNVYRSAHQWLSHKWQKENAPSQSIATDPSKQAVGYTAPFQKRTRIRQSRLARVRELLCRLRPKRTLNVFHETSRARFATCRLTMRLSDARLRRLQTKLIYPNHRLPPWLNGDDARDRSNRLLDSAPPYLAS
jgi:hypothetical protein